MIHCIRVVRNLCPPTPHCGMSKNRKNVGILLLAPTIQGSRIAATCKIEQREYPRQNILIVKSIQTNAGAHHCFLFSK